MEWRALLARLRQALHPDPDAAAILDASERIETGIDRRHFLRAALVGVAAAATVDVEQLLWTPKTILLPEQEVGIAIRFLRQYRVTSLVSADWVAREALDLLTKKLTFANVINRQHDERFTPLKVGDLIAIAEPRRRRA